MRNIISNLDIVPGLDQRLTEELILRHWSKVVGSFLTQKTRPRKLSRGTLYIDVESSALATQLHYMQKEMLDKIKAGIPRCHIQSIKYRVVSELEPIEEEAAKATQETSGTSKKVRIDARIPSTAKEALEKLKDGELRELLRRLIIYNKSLS